MQGDATHVRAALVLRREELTRELESLRPPAAEGGRTIQYGKRAGDFTAEAHDRLNRGATARQLGQMMQDVEHALRRLDAGRYGRCEVCDAEIPPGRLAVLPWATVCVACKERGPRR
ncbi:MAG TPA: TraR/DksA family transcriptional regulator [Candidatus Micrarchaeia archaeon]|nr:TraR/DksA family transcriptional regulator [Candidatus Micrarchaeia archaeon]